MIVYMFDDGAVVVVGIVIDFGCNFCEARSSLTTFRKSSVYWAQGFQMLPFFILSLLLFLIVTVVIVPGLMQQSQEVVEEVVGFWQTPSLLTGMAALLLFLVCIPGGPLHPVMNTVRNLWRPSLRYSLTPSHDLCRILFLIGSLKLSCLLLLFTESFLSSKMCRNFGASERMRYDLSCARCAGISKGIIVYSVAIFS